MIGFTNNVRIFLALEPCDMRKSFNGLMGLSEQMHPSALRSGALLVFSNKRRNRLKLIYFDRTGICILAKRLEAGTFHWPKPSSKDKPSLSLTPEALHLLLDGVDLRGAQMRPWYERGEG